MIVAVLLLVSCSSMVFAASTGEVIDDSIITTKVKSSFVADPTVSALDISVETSHGVVNLSGVVNSEQERQRAIQLAQGMEGVKGVNFRNLEVRR
jgi:osmotically-inducible protein OsmY